MQKPMNFSKKKPTMSLAIILMMSTLSACDKTPSEHLKTLTADKYPVANMPDEPLETPLEINIEPKRLAMTSSWSAGVKDDGTLWTWGTDGLLRDTKTGQDPTPRQVEGVNDAVAVSGDGSHMLLLRKDGTVWGWGSNNEHQIDPNDKDTFIEELREIKEIKDVVDIVAGSDNSLFVLANGDVYALGSNNFGLINGRTSRHLDKPTKISRFQSIVSIDLTIGSILALSEEGEVFTTGLRTTQTGILGIEPKRNDRGELYYPPNKVELPSKAVSLADGNGRVVLLDNGSVYSWGNSVNGETAQGTTSKDFSVPTKIQGLNKVVAISDSAANTVNGKLFIWGAYATRSNNGSSMNYYTNPIEIMNNIHVDQFVRGNSFHGFIDNNGYAWFWGNNRYGEKGTGKVQTEEYITEEKLLTPERSLFNIHANR